MSRTSRERQRRRARRQALTLVVESGAAPGAREFAARTRETLARPVDGPALPSLDMGAALAPLALRSVAGAMSAPLARDHLGVWRARIRAHVARAPLGCQWAPGRYASAERERVRFQLREANQDAKRARKAADAACQGSFEEAVPSIRVAAEAEAKAAELAQLLASMQGRSAPTGVTKARPLVDKSHARLMGVEPALAPPPAEFTWNRNADPADPAGASPTRIVGALTRRQEPRAGAWRAPPVQHETPAELSHEAMVRRYEVAQRRADAAEAAEVIGRTLWLLVGAPLGRPPVAYPEIMELWATEFGS